MKAAIRAFPSKPHQKVGQEDSLFITLRNPGSSPLVAVALHHGHRVRPEVAERLAMDDDERKREEDPFAVAWTLAAPVSIVVMRSRFEVDLDRPRAEAVYRRPEDAGGLRVWREAPPDDLVERSAMLHDAFYEYMAELLDSVVDRHGLVVALDLHSYSELRQRQQAPVDDRYPDIDLGTVSLTSRRWRRVVDCFLNTAGSTPVLGRHLDVQENGRSPGGYFTKWVNERYGDRGCALSVAVKQFFVDESTGKLDPPKMRATSELLRGVNRRLAQALEAA